MSQNGKGSRPRRKSVDQNTWNNNWNSIFGRKNNDGVRVIYYDSTHKKYGYITRRINVDLYEIWNKDENTTHLLSRSEFTEESE